jgi:hypothetical protein
LPFWARGNRGAARAGIRPGDEGRGGDAGGSRKAGAGTRKNVRDRQKNQETNQE